MANEKTYSANQAAKKIGCAVSTITKYIREGKIKAVKKFNRFEIKESEIEKYL